MFTEKPMRKALALAFGGGLSSTLLLAMPVFAQTADTGPQKIERVEVTGSSIKRIDGETALPVQVLTRDDIKRTGASTTEELLKSVSATSSSGSTSVANSGAGGGQGGNNSAALISLRGLGSNRTLVLINGRRSAPSGGSPAVDINSIPVNAIDRIEILKDGASAIYGSDAVAGVVNFILRKDYNGTEVTASYGAPAKSGGGSETKVSVFTGFGDLDKDRYNINLGASIQQIKPIFGADRTFARRINLGEFQDGTSNTTFPANILLNNGRLGNPLYPNCGPESQTSPLRPPGQCRFDNSKSISIQPESKQGNLIFNARLNISSSMEGYIDSSFNRNQTDQTVQPVLINGGFLPAGHPYIAALAALISSNYSAYSTQLANIQGQAYALLPSTSPYYPTAYTSTLTSAQLQPGQPLTLLLRSFVTGQRKTRDTTDNFRVVTGVRGNALGWDYDTGLLFSENKIKNELRGGWTRTTPYLNLLNTGVINPFGPTSDPAAVKAALDTNYNGSWFTNKTSLASVDAKATRELFQLPAGMVNLAVGGEVRKEKLELAPSDANKLFLVSGFGSASVPITASRNVESAFAEVTAPIVKTLDGDVAVRYDNYQRVGSSVNPKVSLRWQPSSALVIRASYGTGFRAPTLNDLYLPPANGITGPSQDKIRCPNVSSGLIDCTQQFVTLAGGNPSLKPEKSKSQTLGFVFQPSNDFAMSVDGFIIGLKDVIRTSYSVATILSDPVKYSSYIVRGAPDGNASGAGPIIGINQLNVNIGKVNISGVDLDLKGRVINTAEDKVTLRLVGTYMSRYDVGNLDGTFSPSINRPAASAYGVILRWKHTASATWETGSWVGSVSENFQVGYDDLNGNFQLAGTPTRSVAPYETYDAQLSYLGFRKLKLTLGVKNLFDQNPPYANYSSVGFTGGYDLSYADVRGRFVYTTATYTFK